MSCADGVTAVAAGARRAGSARGSSRAARLHPHAAGDAELGGAVGRRLRRRVARRRRRSALSAAAAGEEPARLRRRLRHAESAARSRSDARSSSASTSVHEPVTAVQLSRGKAEAQLLFEIALVMQDVGRLAADLLLFYTQEFSFVELPDAFTTGSSIMPQKRNPDVFELIRGRTRHGAGVSARSAGHRREAAVRLSARSAADQGAAVPRHRPVPRHARDPCRRRSRA